MRPARVVALVIGCLLVIPGVALLLGAGALGLGYAFERDDDGFFVATIDEITSSAVAVTAEDFDFTTDPGTPDEVFDRLGIELRQRVTPLDGDVPVFVGIAAQDDLDAYLGGVAHDVVVDATDESVTYRHVDGTSAVTAPTSQDFWDAAVWGAGTQELVWELHDGEWAVVVMNADGSPGVAAEVEVGVKADIAVPIILGLGFFGTVATVVGVVLLAIGVAGSTREPVALAEWTPGTEPVRLEADLDPNLSRWLWLVKWFLAIPHVIVLGVLWAASTIMTFIAGVAILFTGRYPRGIFDFNVGVLRWSWRVSHYAATGGLGTDRYPPFSLRAVDGDAARLDVAYPERLSRGLVLVKWWLLAIPHYLILGIAFGTWGWSNDNVSIDVSLVGMLSFVAGAILLLTGTYPKPLFDLIVGINRWLFRVLAYVGLMTDRYPPFRLDQGGAAPTSAPPETPLPPTRPAEELVGT